MKTPAVHILASGRLGNLYAGVTSALAGRVAVHRSDLIEGFTSRYGVHTLVYYELHDDMPSAIRRETQVKKWNRAWQVRLIEGMNPDWIDLFDELAGPILDGPADVERRRS